MKKVFIMNVVFLGSTIMTADVDHKALAKERVEKVVQDLKRTQAEIEMVKQDLQELQKKEKELLVTEKQETKQLMQYVRTGGRYLGNALLELTKFVAEISALTVSQGLKDLSDAGYFKPNGQRDLTIQKAPKAPKSKDPSV